MSRRYRAATSRHASARHTVVADNNSDDDSTTSDLERLTKGLKKHGLGVRDVRRDGNCFFRAISDQLYGTEEHYGYLRQLCCEYMDEHEDDLAPFLDDTDQSFEDYVDHMRNDGIWAGNIEIHVSSIICNRDIRIHQHGKPSYDLINHGRGTPSMHLFYLHGEHYASVRPIHQLNDKEPVEHKALRQSKIRKKRVVPQQEDVHIIWTHLENSHCELLQKVEHAEAAARFFRRINEENSAERLDTEARYISDKLTEVQERVDRWKRAHAERAEFRETNHRSADTDDTESDTSDDDDDVAANDADGYAWYNEASNSTYDRQTKKERKYLNAVLDKCDARISDLLDRAHRKRNSRTGTDGERQHKPRHPSKRREQEERRKQRKARRRREQESQARRREGSDDNASYTIGVWSIDAGPAAQVNI